MKHFSLTVVVLFLATAAFGQPTPAKSYEDCAYWELIEQIRSYEDTLAFEQSAPDTLRGDYGLPVTDPGNLTKSYKLYRCAALLDTIDVLREELKFSRTSPPVVFRDSIVGVTGTAATFWGKWTSDGDTTITALWFAYGTTAGNLTDTAFVATIPATANTAFSASVSTLTAGTTYYVAAFARNAKGTASSDTLSFDTFQCGLSSWDYQSYTYPTVQIGTQCWFQSNLQASAYRDGTPIPNNLNASAWSSTSSGASSVQGEGGAGEATNLATYGRLYNWYATTDARGLCPTGWSVPDSADWVTLITFLGGSGVAGGKLKASPPPWDGTNSSGFNALDGGNREPNGNLLYMGYLGGFWSTTDTGSTAKYFYVTDASNGVASFPGAKTYGYSIRCIKD